MGLLDNSGIKQFSIEDAEAQNNLEELLPLFKKSTVILGAIAIARSKIEDFDELKGRMGEALKFIDPERLILAPDCGLGFLDESKMGSHEDTSTAFFGGTFTSQSVNFAVVVDSVIFQHGEFDLLMLVLDFLGSSVILLLAFLAATSETEYQVKSGFFLDVIVGQSSAIFPH